MFYDFMIEQFTDQAISLVQAANNGYKEKAELQINEKEEEIHKRNHVYRRSWHITQPSSLLFEA